MKIRTKHTMFIAMIVALLSIQVMAASAQAGGKSGSYSAGHFLMDLNGTYRGYLTAGFTAAGYTQVGKAYGWLGFYPLTIPAKPSSVHEYTANMTVWPQPASTTLHLKGVPIKTVEGGLSTRVAVTDMYGRQTFVPMTINADEVVTVDVSSLATGTYAMALGKGIVVRIANSR